MNRRRFLQSSTALFALARFGIAKEPPMAKFDAAQSTNQFTWELFAKLREKQGNQFLSPYSVSTAMAMTTLGARGATLEQLNQALHLTVGSADVHASIGELQKRLNAGGAERGYQLAVANALWGAKNYEFRTEFLEAARQHYGAGLTSLDFESDPEKARATINGWVEKQTRDKIRNLMPEGTIRTDTRMVLTNAIYFKGDWATQFSKQSTKDEVFHESADKSTKVPMMNRTGDYGYFANEKLQLLAVPYKGKELSMVFVLPRARDGIAEMEKAISASTMQQWLGGLRNSKVIVTLPKFKISQEYKLVPTLREVGIVDAFTAAADFSGMTEKEGLMITDVIHKAFVEVNEEGAEAAAATGVVYAPTSAPVGGPPPTPVFRADHPFVFLIRDNRSGCVLFVGRVVKP